MMAGSHDSFSAWNFLCGLLLGGFGVLYLAISRALERRTKQRQKESKLYKFYINIIISNKKEVIQDRVHEKLESSFPAGKKLDRRGIVPKFAARMVHRSLLSDDAFCEKVANNVVEKMHEQFAKKNIEVEGEVCFIRGCFAVVGVTILSVDAEKIIGSKMAGDDDPAGAKRSVMGGMLALLGMIFGREEVEVALEAKIAQIVAVRAQETMAEEMARMMKKKGGLETEIVVRASAEQADFFFELLKWEEQGKNGEVTSFDESAS